MGTTLNALLYSLSFAIKEIASERRILYEDLQYITLRLDLSFGPLIVSLDNLFFNLLNLK